MILLGQTLGPFSTLYNQLAVRYLMPRLEVYARDRVSVDYLRDNFRVNASLSADLAFADLPLQGGSYDRKRGIGAVWVRTRRLFHGGRIGGTARG